MEGFTWNGKSCQGKKNEMNWFTAMEAAQKSRFLGKSDWRIPTKAELESVVGNYVDCKDNNYSGNQYAVSSVIAGVSENSRFGPGWNWSSTPFSSSSAWRINFNFGDSTSSDRDGWGTVRLVRAGQSSGEDSALEAKSENAKMGEYKKETSAMRARVGAEIEAEMARKDFNKPERATAQVCSRFSPGDTGTVRGPSRLSSDVNYVVRYVNASKGTITIEATSSGELNMNRGEMRQVNCSEVGSDGRIEIYYK